MIIADAIKRLCPDAQFSISGNSIDWVQIDGNWIAKNVLWIDNTVSFPTKQQLDEMVRTIYLEYKQSEYKEKRKKEYPPLTELADALYHQQNGDDSKMTAYLAKVEAVKQKYPKE